ncbi:hypothetical protein N7471_013413 [Penicillium samsonianum]|uniref:uncharacterized protein n=1 Tax=Penicillium samsonianum TaxID=1882272 RepID=UPI00254999ED|nr:uncharacterized protein N7471_013413 [Penicillium samsonianum]KAJ6118793.1 hypothetical protein N7471_013413 [Penicillium samsonianum]
MPRHNRPSVTQARNQTNQTGKGSRYAPLDRETSLKMSAAWVEWIRAGQRIKARDEKRIHEAFGLVADKNRTDPYTDTLQQAHAIGGEELTAIIALAIGKSAHREMKKTWRKELPAILAQRKWHLSTHIRKYVHNLKGRLTPAGEEAVHFSESASAGTATSKSPNEPDTLLATDPTPSQRTAVSLTPQSQYQTELTGSVYELTPDDLLELSTGLITQKAQLPRTSLADRTLSPASKSIPHYPHHQSTLPLLPQSTQTGYVAVGRFTRYLILIEPTA